MIRYRKLYESEDSDIKLYDTVRCGDYDWYVIGIEGDIVTLLAKNSDFGVLMFDEESSIYENSEIRRYLKNKVLPRLQNVNPISTDLKDVFCTDKVWLLSMDEAKKLPRKVKFFSDNWWLRSRGWYGHGHGSRGCYVYGYYVDWAAYVAGDDGTVLDGYPVNYEYFAVRPAIRVRIEDLD